MLLKTPVVVITESLSPTLQFIILVIKQSAQKADGQTWVGLEFVWSLKQLHEI